MKVLVMAAATALVLAAPVAASAQTQSSFLSQTEAFVGVATGPVGPRSGFLADHTSFTEYYHEMQRLRSFMDEGPMKSPKEYADRIRNCPKRGFRMPCEILVSSFNEAHKDKEGIEPVNSLEELADYIEHETTIEGCGAGRAEIGAVKGNNVVFIDRPFAFDEKCFRDKGTGVLISSARCGQWCRKHHPPFRAVVNQKVPEAAGNIDVEHEESRRKGNGFTRFVKKYKKPIGVATAIAAGTAVFLLTRNRAEAEASPSINIGIRIGG